MNSYFLRFAYTYKDRYSATVTARVDGSSKFGENNKYAFFPSAGLAWNITQEDFMKDFENISNLKLHTSYGLTGNSEIGVYQSLATVQLHWFQRAGKQRGLCCDPGTERSSFDKSVPYDQAAMFEPSTVALHGLFQNDYQGGEYVAILGGGTVGMFTMQQWAKIFGSRKVVVFDISEERLALAQRLGADEIVNTTKEDYMKTAMEITGNQGYGFVFETAGQVATMHMASSWRQTRAHVCFIGTPHENLTFTPAQWENMNRKESNSPVPGCPTAPPIRKRVGTDSPLFRDRTAEIRSRLYL